MPIPPDVEQRLVAIETQLMHVQRDFEQLNRALLEHRREFDALTRQLARLAASVDSRGAEPLHPHDDKPPHY